MSKPICSLQKNAREELRFSLDEYRGHQFISVRVFVPSKDGADFIPTKSGITFKPHQLDDVKSALTQVEAVVRANGLLTDE